MHPHSDHAEVAYVVIFGVVGLLWLGSMVRAYGWLPLAVALGSMVQASALILADCIPAPAVRMRGMKNPTLTSGDWLMLASAAILAIITAIWGA